MEKILLVAGTRPEIIKLAPVYHALRSAMWTQVLWLHTGQHGDMAHQMLACFDIVPDITLQREGSTLPEFSAGCRRQLDGVITRESWSAVIVQGDTESAFLGALAAFYHRVPVAHVEAGLRTYNLDRPFPEEGLRQMIGRLAGFHFAPTRRAEQALLGEGIRAQQITPAGRRSSPTPTSSSPCRAARASSATAGSAPAFDGTSGTAARNTMPLRTSSRSASSSSRPSRHILPSTAASS